MDDERSVIIDYRTGRPKLQSLWIPRLLKVVAGLLVATALFSGLVVWVAYQHDISPTPQFTQWRARLQAADAVTATQPAGVTVPYPPPFTGRYFMHNHSLVRTPGILVPVSLAVGSVAAYVAGRRIGHVG